MCWKNGSVQETLSKSKVFIYKKVEVLLTDREANNAKVIESTTGKYL